MHIHYSILPINSIIVTKNILYWLEWEGDNVETA